MLRRLSLLADPMILTLLVAIALAGVLPVAGASAEIARDVSNVGIFVLFLLNGMLKEDVEKSGERWFSPAEEARLVEDIQENLPVIVQTLYNFWRNKRSGGTVKREDPKSGRNDPCPCGSGRKFKQCCGRPEKIPEFDVPMRFPS